MPKAPSISGKQTTLAALTILGCSLMFFIERNKIFLSTLPIIITAIFATLLYLYFVFIENRRFILTSFYHIYFMAGLLISATSISGGAEMIEIGAYGSPNGSFWIVLLFFLAGMEASRLGFQSNFLSFFKDRLPTQSWESSTIIITVTTSAIIILSIYIFIFIGSPLTIGVDRVTFWRNFAPEYLSFFPSLVIQSYFFVCFYFLLSIKKRVNLYIQIALFLSYIAITVIVLGEKFSAFVLLASAWLMVASGAFPEFKINVSKVFLVSIISVLLVLLIVFSYIASGRDPTFIFSRIALQAQLIWSILEDPNGFRLMPSSDWICFFGCGWISDGREFMAYKYLPYGLYSFYYDGGTTLSGFTPAMPIVTFGAALAFAIHIGMCLALGILQREISYSIEKENFIASFLLYKVHLGITLAWFAAIVTALTGSLVAGILLLFYFMLFGRLSRRSSRSVANRA